LFLLWVQNMEIYLWCVLKIFILLIHCWRVIFWTRKVSFWGEKYLHLLNNRMYVERSSENLHWQIFFNTNVRIYTSFDEWKQQVLPIRYVWIHSSSRIWMPQPLGVKVIIHKVTPICELWSEMKGGSRTKKNQIIPSNGKIDHPSIR
jgi:hypothetical protein